jgi:hypothetical protein
MSENQQPAGGAGDQAANVDPNLEVNVPQGDDFDPTDPEQAAAAHKAAETLFHQKKHFRDKAIDPQTGKSYRSLLAEERAAKAGDQGQNNQSNPQKQNPSEKDEDLEKVKGDVSGLKLLEEKRDFQSEHGLSKKETDDVYAYAKGNGITPEQALESDFIKAGIEASRMKADADSASPGPSARSPKVGGKTFAQMDDKGRGENYGAVVAAAQSRGKK